MVAYLMNIIIPRKNGHARLKRLLKTQFPSQKKVWHMVKSCSIFTVRYAMVKKGMATDILSGKKILQKVLQPASILLPLPIFFWTHLLILLPGDFTTLLCGAK